jgi:hypothetical protein
MDRGKIVRQDNKTSGGFAGELCDAAFNFGWVLNLHRYRFDFVLSRNVHEWPQEKCFYTRIDPDRR